MQSNKAILVHIDFPITENTQEDLAEFQELVRSAGAEILALVTGKRSKPEIKYFIGSGKVEEIRTLVLMHKPDLIIFNHDLAPAQERNLEKILQCRVVDRTRLILDIFAQRARSFEGRLQVELAQLQHMATRLVRGWTHLERQKGGIGLRGPGETQLEEDRRVLKQKVKTLKTQLQKVRSQRQQGRRARNRASLPIISLVGYTNAGKSTLFNQLTSNNIYVADQLFATLDPTLRKIELPEVSPVILTDTVGFIHHLPHQLIEAFQATLEEICAADLLLHVVDISDANWRNKIATVNEVLRQIGADQIQQLIVYNKIDRLKGVIPKISYHPNGNPMAARIAAKDGVGLDLLKQALQQILAPEVTEYRIVLSPTDGEKRAQLYREGTVLKEELDSDGNLVMIVRKR